MAVTSWIRRQFKNGVITTATSTMTSGATTFTVNTGAGSTFPDGSVGPFIVTVDQGQAAEEKILVTSRSTDTFTVAASGRGYNGTTAQAHTNATVYHTIDQQDLDEANQVAHQTLGAITTSGDLLQGSAANTLTRLALGTTGQFLQAGASSCSWGNAADKSSASVQTFTAQVALSGDDTASWQTPSLPSGWSSEVGATVGYRKLLGRVYFHGVLTQSGAATTTLFTVASAYRPSQLVQFVVNSFSGSTPGGQFYISVTTGGVVAINALPSGGSANVVLDGVSFDLL